MSTTTPPALAEIEAALVASLSSVLADVETVLEECADAVTSALAGINAGGRRGLDAQRSPYGPRP